MRTRQVLGKRIVAVEHERWEGGHGVSGVRVSRLVLEDGTVLAPHAFETVDCPEGDLLLCNYKDKAAAREGLIKLLTLEGDE